VAWIESPAVENKRSRCEAGLPKRPGNGIIYVLARFKSEFQLSTDARKTLEAF
jgi:hypothetical protein